MFGKEKIEKKMENSLQNVIDKIVKWLDKSKENKKNLPDREENDNKK